MSPESLTQLPIDRKMKKQIFNCLESELERIAEILLDDIAQLLFVAKLKVTTPNQQLNECLSLALVKVRDLAYELKPPTLIKFGLLSGINDLLNNKLPGKFIMQPKVALKGIDELMQIAIYRVIQLIINCVDTDTIEGFMYFISTADNDIILKIVVISRSLKDQMESGLKKKMIQSIKPILILFTGTYRVRLSTGCTTMHFRFKDSH